MIYGMYLSAAGMITSSYQQDLVANNLANSETTGFKRDLANFSQRRTADQEIAGPPSLRNTLLDGVGGGTFASPTRVDMSQGVITPTGNNLDAAILGNGFFTVEGKDGQPRLTRDGRFRIDNTGRLTLMTDQANPVLDNKGLPIRLNPDLPTRFAENGQILQAEQPVGQLGLADVTDLNQLKKEGGSLFNYPESTTAASAATQVQGGFLEGSNVDSATELSTLMNTQRQLEANANMIRYQDETLGELVNTVGKVS